ncbi:MAG: hypothetical protein JRG70_19825 [Deltaproteobacteria bacterium]|nr:hypothetical protein [Deltaproteobacteria bacterium]
MRYLVGFVFVLALGVMGCSETAGTGGSGGAEGECIRDAAAQACLDSRPWVYTFAGFTSSSWMNFASGTVTGVSASTMHIDVAGEALEFKWVGPDLEGKFEIGESVSLVHDDYKYWKGVAYWEGVAGSSTVALAYTDYSNTGLSPPFTPSLMPPVDLAWTPHCTYGFHACAAGCDYATAKLDLVVTDGSTVTTLAAGESVELGSGWTLLSQGGEETFLVIPAVDLCHVDPTNGRQLTALGPAQ